jgi:hypothetical protein
MFLRIGLNLAIIGLNLVIVWPAIVPVRAQNTASFSCLITNDPVRVLDAKTKTYVDHDENWRADCKVKTGDKLVWSGALPLPMYATEPEANAAVEDFRKNKLPEILKKTKK